MTTRDSSSKISLDRKLNFSPSFVKNSKMPHHLNVEQLAHLFDPILMCPFCYGPMSDECCITCGASPQYSYDLLVDGNEDTSELWPLPELKPSYLWDEHGLDCDCPECSNSVLLNQEREKMSELIETQVDHAGATPTELDIDWTCHDDMPTTVVPPT